MATLLPLELIYTIIEIVDHQPTLAALSLVCHEFRNSCTPRLWHHLDVHGFADLASMILALRSNPQLSRHVQTVAFMLDETSAEAYWNHAVERVECSPSCFNMLPQSYLRRILDVGEEDAGVTGGYQWSTVEMLPQKLLRQLDADVQSSLLTSPTGTLRCLCFDGKEHIFWEFDVVKPFALHLYGQPTDWTLHEGPGDEPTFARFSGIKCICFSIYTWDDDEYIGDCNIFERCREYDRDFSVGGLDRVVVRIARGAIGKVYKVFEQYQWPKARDIVEFRLWDFTGMSSDDAVKREFINGTWYEWVDRPEVLGQKVSVEDLRALSVSSGQ